MTTNWIPRLTQYGWAAIRGLRSSLSAMRSTDFYFDTDVDGRRMRSDLDAIRSRFPDHA